MVDGRLHHFESRGLYDGVSVLWDEETGTLWHHMTGDAMHGPLAGARLDVHNLMQTTAARALDSHPDIDVAISARPINRESQWAPWRQRLGRVPVLGRLFTGTIDREDDRLPTMDVGLGVWTGTAQRYYPMSAVQAAGGVVLERFDGRTLAVYYDPAVYAMAATFVETRSARWESTDLVVDRGRIRGTVMIDAGGARRALERPLQVFTRWYGFSLTFPGTTIYEP